jgi:uncharacterized protein YmfQ (DUF2313 family)
VEPTVAKDYPTGLNPYLFRTNIRGNQNVLAEAGKVDSVIAGLKAFMAARTDLNPVSENEYVAEWNRLLALD